MQLHELKSPKGSRKRRRIVGRGQGSGWGKTSGRGENGQNSRPGRSTTLSFQGGQMPLIRRIPKVGFINAGKTVYQVVKLNDLDRFEDGTVVTTQMLRVAQIISSLRKPCKVLGNGKLTKKITVQAQAFSKAAADAITKAGGKAEVVKLAKAVQE